MLTGVSHSEPSLKYKWPLLLQMVLGDKISAPRFVTHHLTLCIETCLLIEILSLILIIFYSKCS